jgi:hypothetical protein
MQPPGKTGAPRMPFGIQEPVVFLHGSVHVAWMILVGLLEKIILSWPV